MDKQQYVEKLSEISKFVAKLSGKDDRDLAIVSVAILDELIKDVFQSKVVIHIGERPPLGLLDVVEMPEGRQLTLLKELNIIDGNWCGEIRNLRKIRHEFAHTFKELTFDAPHIDGMANSLKLKDEAAFKQALEASFPKNASKNIEADGFYLSDKQGFIIFASNFSGNPETPKGRFLNSINASYAMLSCLLLDALSLAPSAQPSSRRTHSQQ